MQHRGSIVGETGGKSKGDAPAGAAARLAPADSVSDVSAMSDSAKPRPQLPKEGQ